MRQSSQLDVQLIASGKPVQSTTDRPFYTHTLDDEMARKMNAVQFPQ
jgi:hypothetical protein